MTTLSSMTCPCQFSCPCACLKVTWSICFSSEYVYVFVHNYTDFGDLDPVWRSQWRWFFFPPVLNVLTWTFTLVWKCLCVCVCFWLSAMYIIFHSVYLSIFCMFEDIMYKDCAVGNSLSLVLWVCQTSACRVSFDDLCFILIGTSGVGWLALMYRALVLVYI